LPLRLYVILGRARYRLRSFVEEQTDMRTMRTLVLAVGVCALALGGLTLRSAGAADIPLQQGQIQAPPPAAYPSPPPVAYYPPPPVAYYPPPPVAYYAPTYPVWPGPYYARWGYWRGYGARFAYGYGRWGHGWHR
jgi:hypothetical protein